MPCDEKDLLLSLYSVGVARYSTTVNDLNLTRGKTSKWEYNRLKSLSEDAWGSAEAARLALEWHTQEHGC
jgi:hypothetical protein